MLPRVELMKLQKAAVGVDQRKTSSKHDQNKQFIQNLHH